VIGLTNTYRHQQLIGVVILVLFLLQLVFELSLLIISLFLDSLELLSRCFVRNCMAAVFSH
jgi:hypothetical protein